jgi:hypothetical protein
MDFYMRDCTRNAKLRFLFSFLWTGKGLVPNFSSWFHSPSQWTPAFCGSTVMKPTFYSMIHSQPPLWQGRETLYTCQTVSAANIQLAIKEMTADDWKLQRMRCFQVLNLWLFRKKGECVLHSIFNQLTVDIAWTSPLVIWSCRMCFTMSNWAAFIFGMFLSAIIFNCRKNV